VNWLGIESTDRYFCSSTEKPNGLIAKSHAQGPERNKGRTRIIFILLYFYRSTIYSGVNDACIDWIDVGLLSKRKIMMRLSHCRVSEEETGADHIAAEGPSVGFPHLQSARCPVVFYLELLKYPVHLGLHLPQFRTVEVCSSYAPINVAPLESTVLIHIRQAYSSAPIHSLSI
jgi:hypothetical protein